MFGISYLEIFTSMALRTLQVYTSCNRIMMHPRQNTVLVIVVYLPFPAKLLPLHTPSNALNCRHIHS